MTVRMRRFVTNIERGDSYLNSGTERKKSPNVVVAERSDFDSHLIVVPGTYVLYVPGKRTRPVVPAILTSRRTPPTSNSHNQN
jgi:hypothetical protein